MVLLKSMPGACRAEAQSAKAEAHEATTANAASHLRIGRL
jgi:hypothetical protein